MLRRLPRLILFAALGLVALGTPLTANAQDEVECTSTQAAINLRSCTYCREVKRILSDPALEGVSFEVTPLRLGATVAISADGDEARLLMQEFVELMWGPAEGKIDEHTCDYCLKRTEMLDHVLVDWTSTGDHVELVLITEDRELAQWALKDARSTQGWVLSSAEN